MSDSFSYFINGKAMRLLIQVGCIVILMLLLKTATVMAQDPSGDRKQAIKIEGTEMERLGSVADVLDMLPEVSIENGTLTVSGLGTPVVFIGKRKIEDLSELLHITADRVKEIEIVRQPGAEYEKNARSAIVIRLKRNTSEGFSLDNTLGLSLTRRLSLNEELSMAWKKKALSLRAFIGFNETHSNSHTTSFKNTYLNKILIKEDRSQTHSQNHKQMVSARFSAGYDFSENSRISFNYSFTDLYKNRSLTQETSQEGRNPNKHHSFALEYSAKLGQWNLSLGQNSFIDNVNQISEASQKTTFNLRDEFSMRTYATVSRELRDGSLTIGLEHNYDHMNVRMYEDGPSISDLEKRYYSTHAHHPDHDLSAFVSASKSIGRWSFTAGLRYEHVHSVYRPYDDDGLMRFLDEFKPYIEYDIPERYYLIPVLMKKREVSSRHDIFYPSLKISAKIGESELSLTQSGSSVRPYLGVMQLRFREIELLSKKILWTEKMYSTSLEWKKKQASVALTYFHYDNPICKTLSLSQQYNAPGYNALDLDINVSPKIGPWKPMLHARLHKQWFKMPLASGKERLLKPYANVTFNNALTLAHGWIIRLDAQWHSRGAERNVYYFKPDFRMDAFLQKDLPRQGLTFSLNAENILRSSYRDIGNYVQDFYGISQGIRSRNARTISLEVRYKM